MRISSVPFSAIPEQSRLFLDYQSDPASLRKFYPNAVSSVPDLTGFAPTVLANYTIDRTSVCDALVEINTACGASAAAMANIERLREESTVAVLTGQQTGLFTGPLYTIYKALSAVKLAERLSAEGVSAVSLFWAATEDHDFDEVANTSVVARDGSVSTVNYDASDRVEDSPVGSTLLDATITEAIRDLTDSLPRTDLSGYVEQLLSAAWEPGRKFGAAFLVQMAEIFRPFGLVFVDPQNIRLKRLSASICVEAIASSDEIYKNVTARSNELVSLGYHSQVVVGDDYFPLFWQTDQGVRSAIRRTGDGDYRSKADKREFTTPEMLEIAASEPERFSPGVMLRPVVQDYLFPTICYFGGGAEIAYFGQNSAVYETLGRPVTPVLHRQSFTVIEPRHERILNDLDLDFTDLFAGIDSLLPSLIEKHISPDTAKLFADVEERLNTELDRLDQSLTALDVTLAANLAKRRRKMIYHIDALRKKAYRAELRKSEMINGRIAAAFSSIYPNGHLQERSINIVTYLNKYGPNFVDWLYDSIDLDDRGHRLIHL
ncbi:MAG: bacillithiol biosynthesis cysteine-adding enzyme BshC [Acidobacteria bacterium]|nr:bacillithiol biosynthesis cysteine-adding enzyme BshC [Acidobacteriota bacterium]